MATLKIQRPNEYLSFGRRFEILLNGETIGEIENNETKEFSIPEGKHTLTAKIEILGSRDLSIEIDETKTKNIKVKNNVYIYLMTTLGIFLMFLDIILFRFFDTKLNLFISSIFPILMIFYFILGRKNHLAIEDLDKK